MLVSMTGYSSLEFVLDDYSFCLEIKTTNHRFLDLRVKIPNIFNFCELKIRELLKNIIVRGSIDFNLKISEQNNSPSLIINFELLKKYLKLIEPVLNENKFLAKSSVVEILKLPDVLQKNEFKITDTFKLEEFFTNIDIACQKLLDMQIFEGKILEKIILEQIDKLSIISKSIEKLSEQNFSNSFDKLKLKLEKLIKSSIDIDDNRILLEAGILSDKMDIKEELDRINTHIEHFLDNVNKTSNSGRILDFILQELNREFNTIASKTVLKEISLYSIEAKSIIEKIKEQIQNVK